MVLGFPDEVEVLDWAEKRTCTYIIFYQIKKDIHSFFKTIAVLCLIIIIINIFFNSRQAIDISMISLDFLIVK